MDNKIKHLEFIQSIISRMAHNSFLIKWWVILGFVWITSITKQVEWYICLLVIMIFMFWFLDSYFLALERKFRVLYDKVRVKNNEDIDFDMKISKCSFREILGVFRSITKLLFYGTLLWLSILFYFLIK